MSSVAAVGLPHRKYALKRELGTENLLKNIPLVDVRALAYHQPLLISHIYLSFSLHSDPHLSPALQILTSSLAIPLEHFGEEGRKSLHGGRAEEVRHDEGIIGFEQRHPRVQTRKARQD